MNASKLLVALTGALLVAATSAIAQTPAATPAPAAITPAPAPAATNPAPAPAAKASGEHQLSGVAAYYSNRFNGRKTASGQRFNNGLMTAAHNTLPFGTKVKVTNTKNKRSVVVRINDRGPTTPGRVFDLSRAAASKLGYVRSGLTEVTAEIVAEAPMKKGKRAK
jgi:rare lipoprotein A